MTSRYLFKSDCLVYKVVSPCVFLGVESMLSLLTVNTDTDTAVVNVRYGAKDQARQ